MGWTPWSVGHPFLVEGTIAPWTNWIALSFVHAVLHLILESVLAKLWSLIMNASKTFQDILRNTPKTLKLIMLHAATSAIVTIDGLGG